MENCTTCKGFLFESKLHVDNHKLQCPPRFLAQRVDDEDELATPQEFYESTARHAAERWAKKNVSPDEMPDEVLVDVTDEAGCKTRWNVRCEMVPSCYGEEVKS